jgi:hypothetical protein
MVKKIREEWVLGYTLHERSIAYLPPMDIAKSQIKCYHPSI